jgi:hypothetical protein
MQKQFPKEKKKKGGVLTTIENTTTHKHGNYQFNQRQSYASKNEVKTGSFDPYYKREYGVVEKILVRMTEA